jgi:hypothetical protein
MTSPAKEVLNMIKYGAGIWAEGKLRDESFIQGINYLISTNTINDN